MVAPLEIRDLHKSYANHQALKGVSFSIEKGQIFGLLGPNGAGKTTLISILTTFEEPTRGEVNLFGTSVLAKDPWVKAQIGVVPQEIVNHGFFSVREVLNFQAGYFGKRRSPKIEELLEKMRLQEHAHKRVNSLSGGMKRRFMIAKALVHEPQLLLLDEPTAGVDLELRTLLWEFVRELQKKGTTILLTTHYLEEAQQLCDQIGIMDKGSLVYLGKTGSLLQESTHRRIHMEFSKTLPAFQHPDLLTRQDKNLEFRIPSHQKLGDWLRDCQIPWETLEDLRTDEGTLEEAMIEILKRNKT
jgi:ABC-2 type transport system ATP-binding protein